MLDETDPVLECPDVLCVIGLIISYGTIDTCELTSIGQYRDNLDPDMICPDVL